MILLIFPDLLGQRALVWKIFFGTPIFEDCRYNVDNLGKILTRFRRSKVPLSLMQKGVSQISMSRMLEVSRIVEIQNRNFACPRSVYWKFESSAIFCIKASMNLAYQTHSYSISNNNNNNLHRQLQQQHHQSTTSTLNGRGATCYAVTRRSRGTVDDRQETWRRCLRSCLLMP